MPDSRTAIFGPRQGWPAPEVPVPRQLSSYLHETGQFSVACHIRSKWIRNTPILTGETQEASLSEAESLGYIGKTRVASECELCARNSRLCIPPSLESSSAQAHARPVLDVHKSTSWLSAASSMLRQFDYPALFGVFECNPVALFSLKFQSARRGAGPTARSLPLCFACLVKLPLGARSREWPGQLAQAAAIGFRDNVKGR